MPGPARRASVPPSTGIATIHLFPDLHLILPEWLPSRVCLSSTLRPLQRPGPKRQPACL